LDVLNDCENGQMVAVNGVSSLTTILQEVMSDKEMQKHLGRSARHAIESKFTLENELNDDLVLHRELGLKV
jgi:glycosyltransferase involved in cell wall biosynthesis